MNKEKKRIKKRSQSCARRSVETMQPSEGHFFVKTNNLLHFIFDTYYNFHSFIDRFRYIFCTFMQRHMASHTSIDGIDCLVQFLKNLLI